MTQIKFLMSSLWLGVDAAWDEPNDFGVFVSDPRMIGGLIPRPVNPGYYPSEEIFPGKGPIGDLWCTPRDVARKDSEPYLPESGSLGSDFPRGIPMVSVF